MAKEVIRMSSFKVSCKFFQFEIESVRLCGRDIATIQTNSDAERDPHQIKQIGIVCSISFLAGIGTSRNFSVILFFLQRKRSKTKQVI